MIPPTRCKLSLTRCKLLASTYKVHLVDDTLQLNAHYLQIGNQIVNCFENPTLQRCIFLWHTWVQGGPCQCHDTPCWWYGESCNDCLYTVSYDLRSEWVDWCNGWVSWDQSRATRGCGDMQQGANWRRQGAPCKCALTNLHLVSNSFHLVEGLYLVGNTNIITSQE